MSHKENTNLQIIDPKEFGIEEERAIQIVQKFSPLRAEIEAYTEQYDLLLKEDINPDTCKKAKELRLKYRDIRTKQVNVIHKAEKDFYLAGGKFVDAWKNKLNVSIEIRESKLEEIEKYYENIQKAEIQKADIERKTELSKYMEIDHSRNYGEMDSDVWDAFLTAKKTAYEDKIQLEKEEAERKEKEESLNKIEQERRILIAPFAQFTTGNNDLRDISDEEFDSLILLLAKKRDEYEKGQEVIREENERLKKEDLEKQAKRTERSILLKKYNSVIYSQDYESLLSKSEDDFKAYLKNLEILLEKQKKETEENEKVQKEKEKKREALEKELNDKKIAEEKRLKAEQEKQENLKKGDDKLKLKTWLEDLKNLEKSLPSFTSEGGIYLEKMIKEGLDVIKKGIIERSRDLI